MSYLNAGVSWMLGQLGTQTGETVVYRRGAQSVTLTATATDRTFPADNPSDKVYFVGQFQAWVIRASQLIIAGSRTFPQRGDKIEAVRNGATVTYEILPDGDQVYTLDPTGQMLTVYTREV